MNPYAKLLQMTKDARQYGSYSFSFHLKPGGIRQLVGRLTCTRMGDGVRWTCSYLNSGKWMPEAEVGMDYVIDRIKHLLAQQAELEKRT